MIGPAELEDLLSDVPDRFVPAADGTTEAAAVPGPDDESAPATAMVVDPLRVVRWWLGATGET